MPSKKPRPSEATSRGPSVFGLIGTYRWLVLGLVVLAIGTNALTLVVPTVISRAIDATDRHALIISSFIGWFSLLIVGIFVLTYLQSIAQAYVAERVAKDLREKLAKNISQQTYSYLQTTSSGHLLTTLTSDVDAVKQFIGQATVAMIASVFLIVGASVLLLLTNWRLACVVLVMLPAIGVAFALIFGKVGGLFRRSQGVIDSLNKVINESILGASLIRVLHAQETEFQRFIAVTRDAQGIGMELLRLFASLIPIVTLVSNLATLAILVVGGRFVINGTLTLGAFSAFNTYVLMLIFPILMLGFLSSLIGRATASYGRISAVLSAEPKPATGALKTPLTGEITVDHVSLTLGGRPILKDISFDIKPGSKTAILGPTGGGKTQLLYSLIHLISPDTGKILYDGIPLDDYEKTAFHQQIGLVFQDSTLFNLTMRENIAFNKNATEESLRKAIQTAELSDFLETLPEGLDTVVSERGTSLSGGQKQRLMLARALAIDPKILLLDDFTARIDIATEKRILANIARDYPNLTLISVTQKAASAEQFDQVLLVMEGEILASGTHQELMKTCPEYIQIARSQESANTYDKPESL